MMDTCALMDRLVNSSETMIATLQRDDLDKASKREAIRTLVMRMRAIARQNDQDMGVLHGSVDQIVDEIINSLH